jgi:hypothetical protein
VSEVGGSGRIGIFSSGYDRKYATICVRCGRISSTEVIIGLKTELLNLERCYTKMEAQQMIELLLARINASMKEHMQK